MRRGGEVNTNLAAASSAGNGVCQKTTADTHGEQTGKLDTTRQYK